METRKCFNCNWEWTPRVDNPKECPKCKSYKWNECVIENITPEGGLNDGKNKDIVKD